MKVFFLYVFAFDKNFIYSVVYNSNSLLSTTAEPGLHKQRIFPYVNNEELKIRRVHPSRLHSSSAFVPLPSVQSPLCTVLSREDDVLDD